MAYGFEARLLMFEAIRGPTCQRLLRAKPPQMAFLSDQCVFSAFSGGLFRPGRAAKVPRKGNWGSIPEHRTGIKWPHGEALLFASIIDGTNCRTDQEVRCRFSEGMH